MRWLGKQAWRIDVSIAESKLSDWAQQGSTESSKNAYRSVCAALNKSASPLINRTIDIYLQGSYRNGTNLSSESDIDVVVELRSSYLPDTSRLTPAERVRYEAERRPSDYGYEQFRGDVLSTLRATYAPNSLSDHPKCIKVRGGSGRQAIDVVPSLHHRTYLRYPITVGSDALDGIVLFPKGAGARLLNYPKQHFDGGVLKSKSTNGHFKPAVRMFKNARLHLTNKFGHPPENAPSYFMECLIANVPDSVFGESLQATYQQVTDWLASQELGRFTCLNAITPLFGTGPTCWNEEHARELVDSLRALWVNGA
jgi:hypothetical protein